MHTSTPTHPHTCTHAHTHTSTLIHTHACTHTHAHTCTHTHTHAHTCRHTHSHTCTHTHAHTHTHTHYLHAFIRNLPIIRPVQGQHRVFALCYMHFAALIGPTPVNKTPYFRIYFTFCFKPCNYWPSIFNSERFLNALVYSPSLNSRT